MHGRYGFGTERTLEQYWEYAGANPKNKSEATLSEKRFCNTGNSGQPNKVRRQHRRSRALLEAAGSSDRGAQSIDVDADADAAEEELEAVEGAVDMALGAEAEGSGSRRMLLGRDVMEVITVEDGDEIYVRYSDAPPL